MTRRAILLSTLLAADVLAGCKSPQFASGSGYATGPDRKSTDASKEDLKSNSAFDDDKEENLGQTRNTDSASGDEEAGYPGAPDSVVDVIRLCSNNYTQQARTNLKAAANGVVVSLIPMPDNDKGKPVHLHSAALARRVRGEVMNYGKFKLPLQDVKSGSYQLVVCDAAYANACKTAKAEEPSVVPVGKGGVRYTGPGVRWGTTPGVLGSGIVEVSKGRITEVSGAFIPSGKVQVIEVLTDRNVEDTLMMNNFFNTFAQMTGAGTVQPTNLTQADMQSIQDCDESASPLIIDMANKGIAMMPPFPGASFDLDANGKNESLSWPSSPKTPYLVLDLNDNGVIDNGAELFGNHSPSPQDGSKSANGFLALSRYDDNGDKVIDAQDEIFKRLRLWADDGDAVTNAGELLTLESQGIAAVDLAYTPASEKDEFGNRTLQRSVVHMTDGTLRLVVDVWFRVIRQ